MKNFKRILASLLVISLLIGMIPASAITAFGASTTEHLFFATDRHTNTSILENMINAMEDNIGDNELDYLGLGGDMVGSSDNHPAYNSSTVLSEITEATSSLDATNVDIVAGIHDMNVTDDAGIVLPYSGGGAQIYEGKNYYVYGVPESCISGDVSGVNPETEANAFVTWANGSDIDKSKVIFVLSHYPLHQRRNDNDGASYWATALNKVAVGDDTTIDRDVAFFWGHNHTGESSADTAVYHVAPNGSISVQGGSSSQTIYFTYANAGYLNSHSSATLVTVTDETITFTKYKNSSVSTTNTVTRVVQNATLSSITVSGTTEYSVDEELNLTVTANYSDGSTKDVTDSAKFSDYDMSKAGNYTVTVTYEDKTETIDIVVNEIQRTVTDDDGQVTISATSLGLTGIEIENVTGTPDLSGSLNDYVTYNVELENYTNGEEITYVMSLQEGDTTDGKSLYAVAEDGTLTELSYESGVDEDGFATVTFKTTLTGMFAVGEDVVTIPTDAKLTKLEVTSKPDNTKYFVATEDDAEDVAVNITGLVVKATYSNGTDTVIKVLDWDRFGEIENGYSLTIDSKVIGTQTVTVSYTYGEVTYTDEFDITICYKTYTGTNVTLDFDVAGVTEVSVKDNTSADFVVNAMKGYTTKYVAYDINLTGYENGDKVTVTLPVPEGIENPTAYYISDNGNVIQNMNAKDNGDGTISFDTDHFSTYVVSDDITTESGTATQPGTPESSITKYVASEMTVYKKVDTPESGKQYLIVNSSTGTGYGLDGDTTGYATTAFTGGDGYYSSWDEDAQSGTAFAAGSDIYLTTSGAYLWTAGSSSFSIGYATSGYIGDLTNTLDPDGTAGTWTLSSNQLKINLKSYNAFMGSDTYTDYYLYNSGSTWSMETGSGSNVYFYEPVTIYTVEEETVTTPATPAVTYSTEGVDVTDAIALAGQTVTLSSVLYSTTEGDTAEDITASSGITPTYEVVTDKGNPNVITSIDGDVATLSGTAGTAVVKVTYTSGDLVAWDEFLVTANAISDDLYTITMHKQTTDADGNPAAGDEITAPITIKNIMKGMQDSVWAVVKADGNDLGALGDKLTWTMTGDSIGTINAETGVITFNGTEGTATVTAYYTCPGGKVIQASVVYSVTLGNYTVPEDGTDDFPEYPDPGAIRFDKHATAVGNFSETGITQVELSMTGVPYGIDQAIDVVVMLDMTGSMSDNGMEAAEEATKAFVKKIVKNDDGTYNDNRVAVYAFNSGDSSPYELVSLDTIGSDTELETANTAIDTASNKQTSGGTPFDEAAQQCHDVLAAAKTDGTGNDRKQFCVFMSDGGPTTYEGSDGYTYYGGNASGDRAITSYIGGYTSSSSSDWTYNLPTEYWTDDMKADGVTVYTVGLLLQNKPSNPSPYSSMTSSTYDSTTDSLTTIGSHYYFTSTILKNMASDTNKYIDIFSVDNASKATVAFENIAQSILDAATDVKVTDKIAADYTMVFEAPNATVGDALPEGQEMYIEVKDYVLNPVYDTDGTTIVDYTRGTAASLMKLYLGKSGSTYYAASDASGTAYATPTFNQTAIGTMYYWTTTSTNSGVSVTVDGTTYYFDEAGISSEDDDYVAANWYNMASGAYASGNITTTDIVDSDTGEVTGTNSVCNDLIIATPYFVYNASTKMLTWTAAKLSTSELALSYFLYLDESGGYSGANGETEAGTYETNEYAHLSYTNFQGTDCQQTFPVPQMTWNGAQVSYVFYLVNDQGQPVNRAGKVVPFSEAVYVTDVFTYSIVWNKLEQVASLEADYLAEDLVPSVYELYDKGASYDIHVFEDEEGQNLNNHFVIGAGDDTETYTTYVFNTKADATKYKTPGTYAATSTYKCKEYVEGGQYTDNKGAYNIVEKTGANVVETGFDFSNTTVAFAVTWTPGLAEDTVVVDYGLDVVVDVIKNDNMAAGVVGVSTTAPTGITQNVGTYTRDKDNTLTSANLYIDANNDTDSLKELKIGTASVENLSSVRFSLDKTNGMQFTDPAEFYYEADVNYYDENDELQSTSMYSSVTVIPATTVYYEDEFATLSTSTAETTTVIDVVETTAITDEEGNVTESTVTTQTTIVTNDEGTITTEVITDASGEVETKDPVETDNTSHAYKVGTESNTTETTNEDGSVTTITETRTTTKTTSTKSGWDKNSVTATAIQDTDRPGESKISETYDADNAYGYDSAYEEMSQYSMGNAASTSVNASKSAVAEFYFYGTGFDIISMTDTTTGTIVVDVYNATTNTKVKSHIVDNYYGYAYSEENGWYTVDSNSPNAIYQVPVMKIAGLDYGKYYVKITAVYASLFDHTGDGNYDFYLDAIRIYDPCGSNVDANEAYGADGEAYPEYFEVRNEVITAETFNSLPAITKVTDVEGNEYTVYTELAQLSKTEEGTYTDSNGVVYEAELDGNGNITSFETEIDGTTVEYAAAVDDAGNTFYVDSDNNIFTGDEDAMEVSGIVFIDGATSTGAGNTASVTDYANYGPNNELYLAYGQAVAFDLNAEATNGEVASVQLGIKTVGGEGSVEVYGVDANGNKTSCLSETISTATDMYYDITALNGKTVVIKNSGDSDDATVSITNVKVTYTEEQTTTSDTETAGVFSLSRASVENAIATLSVEAEDDAVVEDTENDSDNTTDDSVTEDDSDDSTDDSITEDDSDDATDEGTTEETPDDSTDDSAEEDIVTTITNVIKNIVNKVSNWFSKWFR